MGTGEGGVEGEYHTQEEKVLEEGEFRVGEFGYQVFGTSEEKYGIGHGIYGLLCQKSKCCSGDINLGYMDVIEL